MKHIIISIIICLFMINRIAAPEPESAREPECVSDEQCSAREGNFFCINEKCKKSCNVNPCTPGDEKCNGEFPRKYCQVV